MIHHNFPVLDPGTSPEIIAEISRAPALRQYKEELIKGAQVQQALLCLRQERINQANQRIEHRLVEGLGEKVAEIDRELYFQMQLIHGWDCWADPDFLEDTLNKNPGLRIRANVPTTILVNGFRRRDNGAQGEPVTACEGIGSVKAAIDTQGEVPRSAHETETPPSKIRKSKLESRKQ